MNRGDRLTNQQVLEYCEENYDWLKDIVSSVTNISKNNKPSVLPNTKIGLIAYILGGENPKPEVYDFLKHLTGAARTPETATGYIYNKLHNAVINKEPLNFYWILGMSIKAYNYFIDGNPSVKYFKFSVNQELPNINKIQ